MNGGYVLKGSEPQLRGEDGYTNSEIKQTDKQEELSHRHTK